MTWAMLVPRRGAEFPWTAKRAAKLIDQLGHNRVTLRCDNDPVIEALAREIAQPAKREARPFRRDHQWWKASRMGSSSGWDSWLASQTGASQRDQSPARRKDTVLCWWDSLRHRQRRKAAQTAWTTGQHTDPGLGREDLVHARQACKRRKVGTAIPFRRVCWHAELVVRGGGRHRARAGDQDTRSERQENS